MKKITILLFVLLAINLTKSQTLEEFRAVKITNVDSYVLYTDKNIAAAMDYLASINVNVILPVVWNRGYTLYPSNFMKGLFNVSIMPEFAGRDPLNRLIIEAHRNGMEVLPWYEYGFSPNPSGGSMHILNKFPHWGLKDTSGKLYVKNEFYWMSAVIPEVQNFIISLTTEVLDNYDVDGAEYSDRIPAMPVEGGYDSVTVAIYKSEYGGANPPIDHHNYYWMKWRAAKLSQFYKRAKDSIKARGTYLEVSSSPSQYPWSYDEYLQDSKTWTDSGYIDNLIPQLYRYNYNDYLFELNKAISFLPPGKKNFMFSGMLVKSGSYVIDPAFFLQSLKANRDKNINGEAHFFYEGLRANNNRLGDTLKATYYKDPALNPSRNKQIWRPKATIDIRTDSTVKVVGNWTFLNTPGFQTTKVLLTTDTGYSSVTYNFDVPFSAWFGIYAYLIPNSVNTTKAPYTLYSGNDSSTVLVNQTNSLQAGWYKVKDVYLSKGYKKVMKLDNFGIGAGKYITADGAMIMINRKLSPEVIVTNIEDKKKNEGKSVLPTEFQLSQNYPNPFNPTTKIKYAVPFESKVSITVFNIMGQKLIQLVDEVKKAGNFEAEFDAKNYPSGIYFYSIKAGSVENSKTFSTTKKMLLIK